MSEAFGSRFRSRANAAQPVLTSFTQHFSARTNTFSVADGGGNHRPGLSKNMSTAGIRGSESTGRGQDSSSVERSRSLTLNLDYYWEEVRQVNDSATSSLETPGTDDEVEEEAETASAAGDKECEWLAQVGFAEVASNIKEGSLISVAEVHERSRTLRFTSGQTAAVLKRVESFNRTIRRSGASRAEEPTESSEQHAPLNANTAETPEKDMKLNAERPAGAEGDRHYTNPEDYLIWDNRTDSLCGQDDDNCLSALPLFRLRPEVTGLTYVDDLSVEDQSRLRRTAFSMLTALMEQNHLPVNIRKPPKRKQPHRETGIFGVPLTTLLERDRKRYPNRKCPLFLTEIMSHLENNGLDEEGVLRISGGALRLKKLNEDIDSQFSEGNFSFQNVRVHDTANLLKQFLRDLPIPLLTYEYADLFFLAETIQNPQQQVFAFNLLILLLPEVHRSSLRALLSHLRRIIEHESKNRMDLNNVAVIMAPNLFRQVDKYKGSRSAECEVQYAACTSHIVRLLINYGHILFVVPSLLMVQMRALCEIEQLNNKKAKTTKDVKKALAQHNKQDNMRSTPDGGAAERVSERQTVKIHSPQFSKISMVIEITDESTAGHLLAKFRKKQGLAGVAVTPVSSPSASPALDSVFEARSTAASPAPGHEPNTPSSLRHSMSAVSMGHSESDLVFLRSMSALSLGSPQRLSDAELMLAAGNEELYEVGGNIHARRLPAEANVRAIIRANPQVRWEVKVAQN